MPNMIRVPRAGTLLITLPSDSTSRWTPLRLANGWQLPAPVADFHRQVTRHAWRTQKEPTPLTSVGSQAYVNGYDRLIWYMTAISILVFFPTVPIFIFG